MCKYEILDSVDCMHAPKLVEKFEDISFGKVQRMHQEVIALPGQLERFRGCTKR
jgi:hypothetical protein